MVDEKRAALYITWVADTHKKLDAIAAFILAMTPNHPLFPPPLRPSRLVDIDAGEYNEGEVAEGCARLLVAHIKSGQADDATLLRLIDEVEGWDKNSLRMIKRKPHDDQVADLHFIAARLFWLKEALKKSKAKNGVNLKTPLDVAILYAYEVIQQE